MKISINESALKQMILNEVSSLLIETQNLVNNFDKIEQWMEFTSSDDYYFVQIIKRYKDNPDDAEKRRGQQDGSYHGGAWYLKSWRIHSVDELESLRPEIIKWCEDNNARAYITVNSRSEKETNDYIKVYQSKYSPYDARYAHAEEIVAGQAKSGPNWRNTRLRLFLDIDCPKDTVVNNINVWDETRDMLNRYGIKTIGEYETPSGGLHIILANKNNRNLYPFKKELAKFDNWIDRGLNAMVHPNEDGKIILYSNVETKGY